jgi:hypothetical protein
MNEIINKEQLSLYYGIGQYVSQNPRKGFWGTGAIEQISAMLQKELPGLRGFSATNIKRMHTFYEEWTSVINRQLSVAELYLNRPPLAGDLEVPENQSMGIILCEEIVCGMEDYFEYNEDKSYIKCTNCGKEYLGGYDELVEYNQKEINCVIENKKDEVTKD